MQRRNILLAAGAALAAAAIGPQAASAAPLVRSASGPNAAAIQAAVDQYKADIGGANNGGGAPASSGRREIGWDGGGNEPSAIAFDAFRARGALFATPGSGFKTSGKAAGAGGASSTRFGEIDPSYNAAFTTFSPEKLFTSTGSTITDVSFIVPGSGTPGGAGTPATTRGFGAVFADVDAGGETTIEFYGADGHPLGKHPVPTANNGLSFVGVTYPADEPLSKVRITSGTAALATGTVDAPAADVVAMDDFVYAEPQERRPRIHLNAAAYTMTEGGAANVTIRRHGNLSVGSKVRLKTDDGSAVAGDYAPQNVVVDFAPGEAAETVSIPALADGAVEGIERLSIGLSEPEGGALLEEPSVAPIDIIDVPPGADAPPPGSPGTGGGAARDRLAPRLTGLTVAPASISARRLARRSANASIRYRLSENARVRLTVARVISGKRVGRRCVTGRRAPRRGRACRILRSLPGAVTIPARAGRNQLAFPSRVNGHRLGQGRYVLRARATDAAGNRSRQAMASFRIVA